MIVPQNIEELLSERERLAIDLMSINSQLSHWIESQGGNLADKDIIDSVVTGCMIYIEPWTANENVRNYIESKL